MDWVREQFQGMTRRRYEAFKVSQCEFIDKHGEHTFKVRYVTNYLASEFMDAIATFDGPEGFHYLEQIHCARAYLTVDDDFQC